MAPPPTSASARAASSAAAALPLGIVALLLAVAARPAFPAAAAFVPPAGRPSSLAVRASSSSSSSRHRPSASRRFAPPPPSSPSSSSSPSVGPLHSSPLSDFLKNNPFADAVGAALGGGGEKEEEGASEPPAPTFDVSTLKANSEPRAFAVEPSLFLDLLGASFSFLTRGGSGAFADGYKISLVPCDDTKYSPLSIGDYMLLETCSPTAELKAAARPLPLVLYEFEACPFCRKVREAVSILGLEVNFKPCPSGGNKYRRRVKRKYGDSATFPFLIDPNTGIRMFESDDIVSYLFKTYGDRTIPGSLTGGWRTALTAGLGLLPRLGVGGSAKNSDPPERPLTLWSYESSPFCKLVRERLCEYQIEHTQVSCPRGGTNRQRLYKEAGRFQVPYLQDPNTGVELFETAAILEYLDEVYGVETAAVKYL